MRYSPFLSGGIYNWCCEAEPGIITKVYIGNSSLELLFPSLPILVSDAIISGQLVHGDLCCVQVVTGQICQDWGVELVGAGTQASILILARSCRSACTLSGHIQTASKSIHRSDTFQSLNVNWIGRNRICCVLKQWSRFSNSDPSRVSWLKCLMLSSVRMYWWNRKLINYTGTRICILVFVLKLWPDCHMWCFF